MPIECPACVTDCTDFDCNASMQDFTFSANGVVVDPNSEDFDCLGPYEIRVLWVDCQGNRVTGTIIALTSNLGNPTFQSADGNYNIYSWNPTNVDEPTVVTFQYGKGEDTCSVSYTIQPCVKELPPSIEGAFLPEYTQGSLPQTQGSMTVDMQAGTKITALVTGQQHAYSERLALNVDNTKYMTQTGEIYAWPLAVPAVPLMNIQQNPGVNSEHVWSMSDPNIIYASLGGELVIIDCSSGSPVVTGTGITAQTFGPFEPGPSTNDCILVNDGAGTMCVVDLSNPANPVVVGCAPEPAGLDNAAISINGNYVVADIGSSQIVYNRQMQQQRTLPNGGHGTVALDCNGDEVFAVVDGNGGIRVHFLGDNSGNSDYTLPFQNISGASHFSGLACAVPGKLFGSFVTDFSNSDGDNSSGMIGSVDLCPGTTMYTPYANNYYGDPFALNNYPQQPHATVSKDGSTIIFTSDEYGTPTDYAITCL